MISEGRFSCLNLLPINFICGNSQTYGNQVLEFFLIFVAGQVTLSGGAVVVERFWMLRELFKVRLDCNGCLYELIAAHCLIVEQPMNLWRYLHMQ